MKNHTFEALLLSAVITLPAFAQLPSSTSGALPEASADQTAPAPPNPSANRKEPQGTSGGDFWDGDEPGVAWLVLHPFASKGYVKRHLQTVQNQVDELNQLTTAQTTSVKDLDAHTHQGIQLVSDKTDQADQHGTDASQQAQAAQATASRTNTRLSKAEGVINNIDSYGAINQTEIHFRPGQRVLSDRAKRALDDVAAPLKDRHSYIIEVRSFSPGRGQAAIAASRTMADSVVRYLVLNQNIPTHRIYVLALGNADVTQAGTSARRTRDGRIEISVLKNDIDQLASTSAQ